MTKMVWPKVVILSGVYCINISGVNSFSQVINKLRNMCAIKHLLPYMIYNGKSWLFCSYYEIIQVNVPVQVLLRKAFIYRSTVDNDDQSDC